MSAAIPSSFLSFREAAAWRRLTLLIFKELFGKGAALRNASHLLDIAAHLGPNDLKPQ